MPNCFKLNMNPKQTSCLLKALAVQVGDLKGTVAEGGNDKGDEAESSISVTIATAHCSDTAIDSKMICCRLENRDSGLLLELDGKACK